MDVQIAQADGAVEEQLDLEGVGIAGRVIFHGREGDDGPIVQLAPGDGGFRTAKEIREEGRDAGHVEMRFESARVFRVALAEGDVAVVPHEEDVVGGAVEREGLAADQRTQREMVVGDGQRRAARGIDEKRVDPLPAHLVAAGAGVGAEGQRIASQVERGRFVPPPHEDLGRTDAGHALGRRAGDRSNENEPQTRPAPGACPEGHPLSLHDMRLSVPMKAESSTRMKKWKPQSNRSPGCGVNTLEIGCETVPSP